jgi:hypothetical protein
MRTGGIFSEPPSHGTAARGTSMAGAALEVEESSPGDVDGVSHSPPERGGQDYDYEAGDSLIPSSFTTTATAVATGAPGPFVRGRRGT